MSVNDPRNSADALGKSPADGFPSESTSPPVLPPSSEAPGAIDEFVRDIRSRAVAGAGPAAHQRTRFREHLGGFARYLRAHPLLIASVAVVSLIAVVGIREWPTIGETAGTLGSRLISALSPTRLVELPAEAPAAADPATAVRPRRATPPDRTGDAPRAPESAPSAPSRDQTN